MLAPWNVSYLAFFSLPRLFFQVNALFRANFENPGSACVDPA